jgi:hypothetical protein
VSPTTASLSCTKKDSFRGTSELKMKEIVRVFTSLTTVTNCLPEFLHT